MKIAIEAQRIFRSNKHGMDFVALETIRRLQQLDRENEYYILVSPGEDRCLSESANFHIVEISCPTYPLWEQVALPRAVRKIRPDLLHCTSNTAPVRCSAPLVLTLHDIIFLEKRAAQNRSMYQNLGWHYRRLVVPRILPHCRKVITVSRFEQQRIQQALQLPEEVLTTIHNGVSPHFRPVADPGAVTRKYLPEDRFLFFLGNTDPKKNTPRTLRGYARYRELSQRPLPLLVADLKPEAADELLREHGIEGIRPALRLPGYIPNTDLPAIYSGAETFLYTSLRESFGIPILEAKAPSWSIRSTKRRSRPSCYGSKPTGSSAQIRRPTASRVPRNSLGRRRPASCSTSTAASQRNKRLSRSRKPHPQTAERRIPFAPQRHDKKRRATKQMQKR